MKKMALILLVAVNLTGCATQRIWILETIANGLDPQPQIDKVAE
jgi:hypothetical protein